MLARARTCTCGRVSDTSSYTCGREPWLRCAPTRAGAYFCRTFRGLPTRAARATRPTPARTPDTGHRLRARPRRLSTLLSPQRQARQASRVPGKVERVLEQHRDRHRPHAAGHEATPARPSSARSSSACAHRASAAASAAPTATGVRAEPNAISKPAAQLPLQAGERRRELFGEQIVVEA